MSKYAGEPIDLAEIVKHLGPQAGTEGEIAAMRRGQPVFVTIERWKCGCTASPAGFGGNRRLWRKCALHSSLEVDQQTQLRR